FIMLWRREKASRRKTEKQQKTKDENRELVDYNCFETQLLAAVFAKPGGEDQNYYRQKQNPGDIKYFRYLQCFNVNRVKSQCSCGNLGRIKYSGSRPRSKLNRVHAGHLSDCREDKHTNDTKG